MYKLVESLLDGEVQAGRRDNMICPQLPMMYRSQYVLYSCWRYTYPTTPKHVGTYTSSMDDLRMYELYIYNNDTI